MTWVHIVGGGMSGLSLAAELASYGNLPGKVIVSEPQTIFSKNQTFSYWQSNKAENFDFPTRKYSNWVFSFGDEVITHSGKEWSYHSISSQAFFERCIEKISLNDQCEIHKEFIYERPKAVHIFDSRPLSISDFRVYQTFYGVEFNFGDKHQLNTNTAYLMTEMQTKGINFYFNYLLPLDQHSLLIEATAFSTAPVNFNTLSNEVYSWIRRKQISGTVVKIEKGIIPMGIRRKPNDTFGTPIGTRGEMGRNSSGYTFFNVQKWVQAAAKKLIYENRALPYSRGVLEVESDNIFLKIIEKNPSILPEIFTMIARKIQPDHFAEFMTAVNLKNLAQIIRCAPKKPFLTAAFF